MSERSCHLAWSRDPILETPVQWRHQEYHDKTKFLEPQYHARSTQARAKYAAYKDTFGKARLGQLLAMFSVV